MKSVRTSKKARTSLSSTTGWRGAKVASAKTYWATGGYAAGMDLYWTRGQNQLLRRGASSAALGGRV